MLEKHRRDIRYSWEEIHNVINKHSVFKSWTLHCFSITCSLCTAANTGTAVSTGLVCNCVRKVTGHRDTHLKWGVLTCLKARSTSSKMNRVVNQRSKALSVSIAVGNILSILYAKYRQQYRKMGWLHLDANTFCTAISYISGNTRSFKNWTMTVQCGESQLMHRNVGPSSQNLWFRIMVHHALRDLPEGKLILTDLHLMLCIFRLLYQLGGNVGQVSRIAWMLSIFLLKNAEFCLGALPRAALQYKN